MAGPKKKKKLKKKKKKDTNISERVKKGLIEGTDESVQQMISGLGSTTPFLAGALLGGIKSRRTGSPHTKYPGIKMNKGGSVDARKIAKKYFKGVY